VGLSVLYPFLGEVSLTRPDILIPLLSFTALIIVVFLSLKWTREVFFGIGFFLITVSPTLLNFAKGDTFYFASDRYAYVPSIGILLIVALGVVKLTEHFGWQRPALVASVALLLTLSGMSAAQSLTWKDSEALFSHALRLSPQAYVARVNLGNISRYRGETKDAITQYETALAILRTQGRPGRARDRSESKILSNLASALREDGNFPKAQQTNEQALILNPQNVYALLGLGIIAGQQGKAEDAEASYRRAITLDPEFAPAHLNLGALLVGAGRLEEGVSEYQEALRLNPFFPQAHYNLGVALGKLNRTREAEDAYREAVRLQPKFTAARINLGILLFNRKNVDEATEQFQAILQYDPSNTQARSAIQQIQRQ
jgi:tetratricopeptide (TPR) repeat protein